MAGIRMIIHTDQPGIQFYAGNFLGEQEGKAGAKYRNRVGLALETQYFPDSINKENFPDVVFGPDRKYESAHRSWTDSHVPKTQISLSSLPGEASDYTIALSCPSVSLLHERPGPALQQGRHQSFCRCPITVILPDLPAPDVLMYLLLGTLLSSHVLHSTEAG